jgi:SAM-dependent methyltransferase
MANSETAIAESLGTRFAIVAKDGALALAALNLPKNAAILDVGTGSGNFAIYLAMQGYRVLTGEPATDQTQYAGRDWRATALKAGVLDRIDFAAIDAAKLPFDAKRFDAVFFFGVLHHIPEAQRRAVLHEALRAAKDGGAVVFFEPRRVMLEQLWVEDPKHPLAAKPRLYLPAELRVSEQQIEGEAMDIFIYRKSEGVQG